MTNAEKYEEVFGFPPDKGNCPAERCEICPGQVDNRYLCTCTWWDEEYKGDTE